MATHSNILACKCRRQRSLVGYSPWGSKRVTHTLAPKQQQQLGCLFRSFQKKWQRERRVRLVEN